MQDFFHQLPIDTNSTLQLFQKVSTSYQGADSSGHPSFPLRPGLSFAKCWTVRCHSRQRASSCGLPVLVFMILFLEWELLCGWLLQKSMNSDLTLHILQHLSSYPQNRQVSTPVSHFWYQLQIGSHTLNFDPRSGAFHTYVTKHLQVHIISQIALAWNYQALDNTKLLYLLCCYVKIWIYFGLSPLQVVAHVCRNLRVGPGKKIYNPWKKNLRVSPPRTPGKKI